MKYSLFTYLLIAPFLGFSQNNNWQEFSDEEVIMINMNDTKAYYIEDFKFNVTWDSKFSCSDNIGYYGGIKELRVYKSNKKIQSLYDIEDTIALGDINFRFYDYNLDGYLDFSIPLGCGKSCWEKYYLYNPKSGVFEHKKDWDYLRIQKIDKKNKRILSVQDGNAPNNQKTYQIKGLQLIQL